MNYLQDLSLYLTEKCNLNCTYCYIKKDFESTLTIADAKKAIDVFEEHCSTLAWPTITILGGEPLLTYKLLLDSVDYARKKFNNKVIIILFTNGTLLTPKKAERLISRNVKIFVSLDGIKKINDCYRKYFYSPKISTFDTVISNLKNLSVELRKKIGVNMVVGPKTAPALLRNIKFFQKLGLNQIDFSILSYGIWKETEIATLKSELNKFIRFYIKIFRNNSASDNLFKMDILESLIVKNNHWDQMGNCFRVKFSADKNFYFCDAFLSLDPSKRIKYSVGNLKNGINMTGINRYIKEAGIGLAGVKNESFKWHSKHRRVYCPFSIYFYTKLSNQNLKKYINTFYRLSDIYTASFVYLGNILKGNKKFNKFYFKDKDNAPFDDLIYK